MASPITFNNITRDNLVDNCFCDCRLSHYQPTKKPTEDNIWVVSIRNLYSKRPRFDSLPGSRLYRYILIIFHTSSKHSETSLNVLHSSSFTVLQKIDCTTNLTSFLLSPRCYSSGWGLASWIISLHFSLFLICSDDEASNGWTKKWEECGWKSSWPTYCHWFSIHSIHPRLVIWFLNNLVFTVWGS
jgi:hypothetical protein